VVTLRLIYLNWVGPKIRLLRPLLLDLHKKIIKKKVQYADKKKIEVKFVFNLNKKKVSSGKLDW
jgi:hypothetical protein